MKQYNWLQWVSFICCVLILAITLINAIEILKVDYSIVFLTALLLLSIIAGLLSLFRKYWWLLPVAILLLISEAIAYIDGTTYGGSVKYREVFIVSAVILLLSPFMNIALHRKDNT